VKLSYALKTKQSSGPLLGRREVLLMGAASVMALAGLGNKKDAAFAQNSIVATPSLTEGPYFVDELLNRSDIRVDPTDNSIQEGFPLLLRIVVAQLDNGTLAGTGFFLALQPMA